MITEAVGHEINKMLARCGCHNGNNDEFELESKSGEVLPGEQVRIFWGGELVGTFSYTVSHDGRDAIFVGRELDPVLPTDSCVKGAYFLDGPLENDIDDTVSLIDGFPPKRIVIEGENDIDDELVYYLVYEPSARYPQEVGCRFVYSVEPGSLLQ